MLFSALVAAVLYIFATQQTGQRFSVAVIRSNVEPGTPLVAQNLTEAKVNVSKEQLDKIVRFDERNSVNGYIATSPLASGDLLLRSAIRPPAAGDRLRAMSIPIAKNRAVNGALSVGDRIDVIDTKGNGGIAAVNLEVLATDSGGGGGLTGNADYVVTVALQAADAVHISKAINENKFDIVRSTGAAPVVGFDPPTASTPAVNQ